MYHKSNPWVSLAGILLLLIILAFACTGCTGCTDAEAAERETEPAPRFTYEREDARRSDIDSVFIITDTHTGVQYLYIDGYRAGGLCKLEG